MYNEKCEQSVADRYAVAAKEAVEAEIQAETGITGELIGKILIELRADAEYRNVGFFGLLEIKAALMKQYGLDTSKLESLLRKHPKKGLTENPAEIERLRKELKSGVWRKIAEQAEKDAIAEQKRKDDQRAKGLRK